jgi:hypothetical protein
MKIVRASGPIALLGVLALPLLACDRGKDPGFGVSSGKDAGYVALSGKDAGFAAMAKDGGAQLAQYTAEAGYGMPNPQPGSPISPYYDAGIAPPAPAPSAPKIPYAPSPPTPLPGTPYYPSPTNP